jgi:outer membrane protein assembly factor BamB
VIYFGSHDSNFYALNPDGRPRWKFATQGAILSSPAIADDGTIIFTSVDGRLYAVNPDGSEKWHFWTGGVRGSSPVVDAAGNIYLGVNNMFFVVGPDGTKKWWFGYPEIEGAPALAADGMVYFAGTGEGVGFISGWTTDGTRKSDTVLPGPVSGPQGRRGPGPRRLAEISRKRRPNRARGD